MMSNLICKIWGHSEKSDHWYPVTWCRRCDQMMTEYGYQSEELTPSMNIGRPFLIAKDLCWYFVKNRVKYVIHKYKVWRYGEDYNIPF